MFATSPGEQPVEVTIHRVSDDLLVCTLTEVAEADTGLGSGERLLGSILDAIPLGVVMYDRELRVIRVNRTAEQMGRVRPEHLGRRVTDAFPDVDPSVVEAIRRMFETGDEIVNHELTGPDGQSLLLNFFPIWGGDGVDQVGCVSPTSPSSWPPSRSSPSNSRRSVSSPRRSSSSRTAS